MEEMEGTGMEEILSNSHVSQVSGAVSTQMTPS